MTTRTQRVFCFLVALGLAGAGNPLRAQVAGGLNLGVGPAAPGVVPGLFNSSAPFAVPAVTPALAASSPLTESLKGLFGQNPVVLPNSGMVSAFPEHFSGKTGYLPLSSPGPLTAYPGPAELRFIPSDNYYNQSGFFCKREWEIERSTHIPFRFRLGSLAQCNALEGKP